MGNIPKVSDDWLNFGMQPDGRMPTLVRPEGSVAGLERVGGVVIKRLKGAIDEGTLPALIENLRMLGVELPAEDDAPPTEEQ